MIDLLDEIGDDVADEEDEILDFIDP